MLKYLVVVGLLAFSLTITQASSVHTRYFESVDTVLSDRQFALYNFSALQGEFVTIVAYGLDEQTTPTITLFSPDGFLLAEDLNPEQDFAAYLQITAPTSGLYPFVVMRQNDQPGMIRVMVFEGQPISGNYTVYDEVDPLMPGRAYLVYGEQIGVAAQPGQQVIAARGELNQVPPQEELNTPVEQQTWQVGENFQVVDVRATNGSHELRQFELSVNGGGEMIYMERYVCEIALLQNVDVFNAPNGSIIHTFSAGENIEIIGIKDGWLQVSLPQRIIGGGWIVNNGFDIAREECSRVQPVNAPTVDQIINNVVSSQSPVAGLLLPQAYTDNPTGFQNTYQQAISQHGAVRYDATLIMNAAADTGMDIVEVQNFVSVVVPDAMPQNTPPDGTAPQVEVVPVTENVAVPDTTTQEVINEVQQPVEQAVQPTQAEEAQQNNGQPFDQQPPTDHVPPGHEKDKDNGCNGNGNCNGHEHNGHSGSIEVVAATTTTLPAPVPD